MTSESLSAFAGVLLSLAFSYIPGVREWFSALDGTRKRAIMALALFIVAVAQALAPCIQLISGDCTQAGALVIARNFLAALVANQAVWLISPPIGGDTLPPESRKP